MQGYLFSRPVGFGPATTWLREHGAAADRPPPGRRQRPPMAAMAPM
jgi:hypothetical protein